MKALIQGEALRAALRRRAGRVPVCKDRWHGEAKKEGVKRDHVE
jgi:hypothetical protein